MAFRWRKTVSIIPGLRINLSKSGFSTTVGPRGANVNIGQSGTYLNTSLPGTGLSQRTLLGNTSASEADGPIEGAAQPKFKWFSKGLLIIGLVMWWLSWADSGSKASLSRKEYWGAMLFLFSVGILWQWRRRKAFVQSVADGSYWLKNIGKATHVGERGGEYTINYKGNKVYKKRP